MLARANIESNLRGLINTRAKNDEKATKLFLQKMTLQMNMLDFARRMASSGHTAMQWPQSLQELSGSAKTTLPVRSSMTNRRHSTTHALQAMHFA